jgi:hypothetical protein
MRLNSGRVRDGRDVEEDAALALLGLGDALRQIGVSGAFVIAKKNDSKSELDASDSNSDSSFLSPGTHSHYWPWPRVATPHLIIF